MKSVGRILRAAAVVWAASLAGRAAAQDVFEIQVYPSETAEPGITMFEFHTNFVPSGTKGIDDEGVYGNHHQFHETLEITHGWTKHFETGFYFETGHVPGVGHPLTGLHILARSQSSASETVS